MTAPAIEPGPLPPTLPAPIPVPLPARGSSASAIWTLFRLSVGRLVRSRRTLVVGLLFALPAGLAILARVREPGLFNPARAELALVFQLLPNALVPLSALLFASGMIQEEVEEQTLTYLLIRPLPRWSIYACKLLATALVVASLVALATLATVAAVRWDDPDLAGPILREGVPRAAGVLALAALAYCSLFGILGLFVRRSLAIGVTYIAVMEGVIANWDFAARRLTVMYYVRVLFGRWLGLSPDDLAIDLAEAPSALTSVLTLVGASVVATAIAAFAFSVREFRVKTPEGS